MQERRETLNQDFQLLWILPEIQKLYWHQNSLDVENNLRRAFIFSWNPEYEFLLVESETLVFGIRNTVQGIRNLNSTDKKSVIQYLEPGIHNPWLY